MVAIELTTAQYRWLARKLAADLLVYLGHNASDGLFEREKQQMNWLQEFSDKVNAATPDSGSGS